MKNYFPHDHYARSDKKIINLIRLKGMAGYGLYWCLVEMLYEEGGWLKLSDLESLAYDLRTDIEKVQSLIEDYDLFFVDEESDRFSSRAVLARLELINEKSSKRAQAAKTRWDAARENAKAMQMHNKSNANASDLQCKPDAIKRKENKINENKENQIIEPSVEGGASVEETRDYIGKLAEGARDATLNAPGIQASHTEGAREIFSKARKLFPGTKRGDDTEWENFEKKHSKDPEYRNLPTIILNAIALQVKQKVLDTSNPRYIPMFSTWINQKRWEIEPPEQRIKIIPITSKETNYDELAKEYGPGA